MGYKYAVIGAGRQGTAAAYDLAAHGNADSVVLADLNLDAAKAAAKRVNKLAITSTAKAVKVDVAKSDAVLRAMKAADVVVSGVPYYHNLRLAKLAVKAKASLVDFGGETEPAPEQLAPGDPPETGGGPPPPAGGPRPRAELPPPAYA